MELTDVFSVAFNNINWLAVVVGALAGFAVGSVWYHEKVLGNKWMKAVGLKRKDIENADMVKTFGGSFVLMFLTAVFVAVFAQIVSAETLLDGALLGGVVGVFFVATATGVNYLYSRRSFELFAIDAGYHIVNLMVAGAIIGYWQ